MLSVSSFGRNHFCMSGDIKSENLQKQNRMSLQNYNDTLPFWFFVFIYLYFFLFSARFCPPKKNDKIIHWWMDGLQNIGHLQQISGTPEQKKKNKSRMSVSSTSSYKLFKLDSSSTWMTEGQTLFSKRRMRPPIQSEPNSKRFIIKLEMLRS